jgi:hypothetical protein
MEKNSGNRQKIKAQRIVAEEMKRLGWSEAGAVKRSRPFLI